MKEEDDKNVVYQFLDLVPARLLFFDFGPFNFVIQHMEQHISVVCHVTCLPRHHMFAT